MMFASFMVNMYICMDYNVTGGAPLQTTNSDEELFNINHLLFRRIYYAFKKKKKNSVNEYQRKLFIMLVQNSTFTNYLKIIKNFRVTTFTYLNC